MGTVTQLTQLTLGSAFLGAFSDDEDKRLATVKTQNKK